MASANQKLQQWLLEIEKGLIDLSPGDRAKVIFNLDTQIRSQLSQDEAANDQKIDELLTSIGTPGQVIEQVRKDRGLGPAPLRSHAVPPTKPAKNPSKLWKWATLILVGGFFSFIALMILIPIIVMKFISGSSFHKSFNVSTFGGDASSYHVKGSQNAEGLTHMILRGTNGNVAVTSGSETFTYDCTVKGENLMADNALSFPDESTAAFDFSELADGDGIDCKMAISKAMSADISLQDGNVTVSHMAQDLKVALENGNITFNKDDSVLFLVNASASVGQINGLEELNTAQVSMKPDAGHAKADLRVHAGQIVIQK